MDNFNIFSKQDANSSKGQQAASTDDILNMVRDIMRRLRQLEERHNNMRKTILVIEDNMLKQSKKSVQDIKNMDSDITDMKKHVRNMADEIKHIISELTDSVKKEDVKILEKYISFWQPLNYVTHSELEKEVKRVLKKELAETKIIKDNSASNSKEGA